MNAVIAAAVEECVKIVEAMAPTEADKSRMVGTMRALYRRPSWSPWKPWKPILGELK